MNRERTLARDVTATQIPSGDKQLLASGTLITLHQTLGGSFTVQTDFGLFRIDSRDGDALGEKSEVPVSAQAAALADGSPDPEAIWSQLRTVFDPEIPVNIVELGLIYDLSITPHPAGGSVVEVKMTLTTPGCGMGAMIADDAQHKVLAIPGVTEAKIALVWDPPWSSAMMSEAAKLHLGLM